MRKYLQNWPLPNFLSISFTHTQHTLGPSRHALQQHALWGALSGDSRVMNEDPEVGIYKRKQESKKPRKHAFDQESDLISFINSHLCCALFSTPSDDNTTWMTTTIPSPSWWIARVTPWPLPPVLEKGTDSARRARCHISSTLPNVHTPRLILVCVCVCLCVCMRATFIMHKYVHLLRAMDDR